MKSHFCDQLDTDCNIEIYNLLKTSIRTIKSNASVHFLEKNKQKLKKTENSIDKYLKNYEMCLNRKDNVKECVDIARFHLLNNFFEF